MSVFAKALLASALMAFALPAIAAGGSTAYAVPAKIEIVRGQGFLIFGAYGNPGPNPCTRDEAIWVPISHPQYSELLSSALSAFAGQFRLQAYVHVCTSIGWHSGTYNELSKDGALYITR